MDPSIAAGGLFSWLTIITGPNMPLHRRESSTQVPLTPLRALELSSEWSLGAFEHHYSLPQLSSPNLPASAAVLRLERALSLRPLSSCSSRRLLFILLSLLHIKQSFVATQSGYAALSRRQTYIVLPSTSPRSRTLEPQEAHPSATTLHWQRKAVSKVCRPLSTVCDWR